MSGVLTHVQGSEGEGEALTIKKLRRSSPPSDDPRIAQGSVDNLLFARALEGRDNMRGFLIK